MNKSIKFIQVNIPCPECIVNTICQDKEVMSEGSVYDFLLALPKWDERDKIWRKGLIEAWINLGINIFKEVSDSYTYKESKTQPSFTKHMRSIVDILYFIESSNSWNDGKENDIDKEIIIDKLKEILTNLNAAVTQLVE